MRGSKGNLLPTIAAQHGKLGPVEGAIDRKGSRAEAVAWSNPSVLSLLQQEGAADPFLAVEDRAKQLTFEAMEEGWEGPPYDPFALASLLGIEVVASQELEDARLVETESGPRIDFNPSRRPARVRFSIAHEIGHFLFPDYGNRVRYRDRSQIRADDWQLEVLCNIAAAEFLMPAGAFPIEEADDLSLPHLLDLRAQFSVSTEALLRRTVKLTDEPSCLFAATRLENGDGFRIDYAVPSRSWGPSIATGTTVARDSVLHRCTAVGFSADAAEEWAGERVHVQVVGVPPYPGHSFPRLIGLLEPEDRMDSGKVKLQYVRGNAAEPYRGGPTIIAHVVNDKASSWGGHGFAVDLMRDYPQAKNEYSTWANSGKLSRGTVNLAQAGENLWIASLVAQAGYGEAQTGGRPRLRLPDLQHALRSLATMARELGASVHMPAIGTGQGGMRWPKIRDLVVEELVDHQVPTTIYVLPDAPMPEDAPDDQLSLI
jgi:O-acetyl-ADP-ribose deacetylase (regulator of RNase III)